jgi:hypothetical protein
MPTEPKQEPGKSPHKYPHDDEKREDLKKPELEEPIKKKEQPGLVEYLVMLELPLGELDRLRDRRTGGAILRWMITALRRGPV